MKKVHVVLFLAGVGLGAVAAPPSTLAYSYAAAGAEPLLDGREALLGAAAKGDWAAARAALAAIQPDIVYLEQNEDRGVDKVVAKAIDEKNAAALRDAMLRASIDEIKRRLNGAHDNIREYQTAKVLVVKAQRFYTAVSGDLPPERRAPIEDGLRRALDAIGNPGVFGVGRRMADPVAYDKAQADVMKALAGFAGRA